MSSISYKDLKTRILSQRNNPIGIMGLKVELIEEALENENALFADPSQPGVFLMESSTVHLCAAIESVEVINQNTYPIMANTESQLYNHMTDKDYRDMFASPGTMPILIYVSEEEILKNAIPIPGTVSKKLTIGRHTYITMGGVTFTMQYPIDFLVKSNGAIETVYNGSRSSHLVKLSGNKIESRMIRVRDQGGTGGSVRFLRVPVTLSQMTLVPYYEEPDRTSVLRKTYTFSDKFFAVRAFYKSGNSEASQTWVEMHTTHSEQIFNVTIPTLLVTVMENTVTIELPQVYVLSGMVTSTIRVEVYTTHGDLYESFENVQSDEVRMTYRDLDGDDAGKYTSPMNRMNTITVEATQVPLSGGRNAPTFRERRERLLRNVVYDNVMPISNAQVETVLKDLGFDSTTNIDTLTQRTFLATRQMPVNPDGLSTTGIDTCMMTMRATFDDLKQYETIIDNEELLTVLPDTLYQDVSGELRIVPDLRRQLIDTLAGEELVDTLLNGVYLTSPLHYVLDPGRDTFIARPYYLTDPSIETKSYIASNDSLDVYVTSSNTMTIQYTKQGYLLTVVTDSNKAYRELSDSQVHVQLAFSPSGDSSLTYINGVMSGKSENGERIYEFLIETNWAIDDKHRLMTKGFTQPSGTPSNYMCNLNDTFYLIWSVSQYSGQRSQVDGVVGYHLLPSSTLGIYHEEVRLHLGDELTGLWARSRAYASTKTYKTHPDDVYATWDRNVYHLNPATSLPEVIEVDGVKQLHIKHPVGSPKIDEATGEPIVLHKKGTAILLNGEPILESDRKTERWWEVALFDATYRYATRPSDKEYYDTIPRMLTTWINTSLGSVTDLLERTKLYFHPKNTLRYFDALIDDTDVTTIYGAQSFVITLYVDSQTERNTTLRTALESTAIRTLTNIKTMKRITRAGLVEMIREALGDDVISVTIDGLGSIADPASVVTILDDTNRLTIRKRPSLEPDGTIAIRDAVEVVFKRHSEV